MIHIFNGKNNRTGQNLIICLGFSITHRAARAIQERERESRNKESEFQSWQRKVWTANFSATMVRQEVWREKRKVRFLARESVNSSPILARQWWRHFRLSLFLSLSLYLSLSHRVYLTHNIGSASALPIIQLKRVNHKLSRRTIDSPLTWRFPEASSGPGKS